MKNIIEKILANYGYYKVNKNILPYIKENDRKIIVLRSNHIKLEDTPNSTQDLNSEQAKETIRHELLKEASKIIEIEVEKDPLNRGFHTMQGKLYCFRPKNL